MSRVSKPPRVRGLRRATLEEELVSIGWWLARSHRYRLIHACLYLGIRLLYETHPGNATGGGAGWVLCRWWDSNPHALPGTRF